MKSLLLALVATSMSGCHIAHLSSGIKGSGKLVTVTRSVSGFTRIANELPADVEFQRGANFSVKLTVDDNLEKYVETRIKGDKLVITNDKSINPTKCKLVITAPSLSSFEIQGAGDATISGLSESAFEGKIEGAGSIRVSGIAKVIKLSIEGAGDIKAYDLKSEDANASIDGAGSIEVSAEKSLNASINGAGDVRYRGNPSVKKDVDGVGSVTKQ